MSKPDPSKPNPSLKPKRMSLLSKYGVNLESHSIQLDSVIKNAYDIEQTFNIISIIPTSKKIGQMH